MERGARGDREAARSAYDGVRGPLPGREETAYEVRGCVGAWYETYAAAQACPPVPGTGNAPEARRTISP